MPRLPNDGIVIPTKISLGLLIFLIHATCLADFILLYLSEVYISIYKLRSFLVTNFLDSFVIASFLTDILWIKCVATDVFSTGC